MAPTAQQPGGVDETDKGSIKKKGSNGNAFVVFLLNHSPLEYVAGGRCNRLHARPRQQHKINTPHTTHRHTHSGGQGPSQRLTTIHTTLNLVADTVTCLNLLV
eukprot:m.123417 g.123417  ORF g.123417 m.123417 type:complete len:103 (+) comp13461_c0_seq1:2235-2543(+)